MAHAEPQRRMKLSVLGQACQKKEDRENEEAKALSIEAGYDLKVIPRECPASFVRRDIA